MPLDTKNFTDALRQAREKLEISYIQSPGKGGQNVNKRATACQIIDAFDYSEYLPAENKKLWKSPIVVKSSNERSQIQNQRIALETWESKIQKLFTIQKPRTKRARVEKHIKRKKDRVRLEAKRQRGEKKKLRKII